MIPEQEPEDFFNRVQEQFGTQDSPLTMAAEWNLEVIDPRTRGERAGRAIELSALALLAVGGVLGAIGILYLLLAPVLTFPLAFLVAYALIKFAKHQRPPNPINHLMDLPAGSPQYPAKVQISYLGLKMGEDLGVVTFADNMLHFEGKRTAFGFDRSFSRNPRSFRRDWAIMASYLVLPSTNLRWEDGKRKGTVAFTPFESGRKISSYERVQFRFALDTWASADSKPALISLLPPIQPDHETLRKLGRDFRIASALACLFALSAVGCVVAESTFGKPHATPYLMLAVTSLTILIVAVVFCLKQRALWDSYRKLGTTVVPQAPQLFRMDQPIAPGVPVAPVDVAPDQTTSG